MFGTFQHSHLRIEVEASANQLSRSLLVPTVFSQWLAPQRFSSPLPQRLGEGDRYRSYLGPLTIDHQVQVATDQQLRLILSGAIDGFHAWHWGDGWIQSRIEGISILPLGLGHSLSLARLQQHLKAS